MMLLETLSPWSSLLSSSIKLQAISTNLISNDVSLCV